MAEYLELEKVLDDRNIITVQTKEYGSIEVIPVDSITDVELADVQPVKHGRWENEYLEDDGVWWADCTNCKNDSHSRFGGVSIYAYCPNCGARMNGDTE